MDAADGNYDENTGFAGEGYEKESYDGEATGGTMNIRKASRTRYPLQHSHNVPIYHGHDNDNGHRQILMLYAISNGFPSRF